MGVVEVVGGDDVEPGGEEVMAALFLVGDGEGCKGGYGVLGCDCAIEVEDYVAW